MGDEAPENTGESTGARGLSRRAALRAGVATGVGVAAWSGASITSMGGTPAYATACTGAIPPIDIGDSCRNTDQGCTYYGWHPTKTTFPSGFSLLNPVANSTCCDAVANNPRFTWTLANLTCKVILKFGNAPNKCGGAQGVYEFTGVGGASGGYVDIVLKQCYPFVTTNTFYSIEAHCYYGSNPPDPECFT